ncbi:hypothetical protein MIND_00995600 [Mycena indigotica]|uniref:Uncharacterized protein n=1 Tax=Mycena indigotica TaxID=2126181 RepID=A0A8H6S7Z5_9AGAR|nr:uncharacterized protein MIND_00995600 [Mycena indigotica]KAF7294591.1 hypothetical protein MIND_00995600 [Mycena indigotica]
MTALPSTPVIRRRPAPLLSSRSYTRYNTDFRVSHAIVRSDAKGPLNNLNPFSHSEYRPTKQQPPLHLLSTTTPTFHIIKGLDSHAYADASQEKNPKPPALEEHEEKENQGYLSRRTDSCSPSTPSSSLGVIEEDELEDDTSPPPASSDPLFPDISSSSPYTSDLHSPVDKPQDRLRKEQIPNYHQFASELNARLLTLDRQQQHPLSESQLLKNNTYSSTPDYPCEGSPHHNSFGPISQRSNPKETYASFSPQPSSTAGYEADSEVSFTSSWYYISSSHDTPTQTSMHSSTKRFFSSLAHHSNDLNCAKKPKLTPSRSSSRPTGSTKTTYLPTVPASIRKSLSLRSETTNSDSEVGFISSNDEFVECLQAAELVPTQLNSATSTPSANKPKLEPFHVPIIAPPIEHIARLPITQEVAAKTRINNFILREERCRISDGMEEVQPSTITNLDKTNWEGKLGIGAARRQVVKWFLEVMPSRSMYSNSGASSRSNSFASQASDNDIPGLVDQLQISPETRFCGAYLYLRYFHLLTGNREEIRRIESWKAAAVLEDCDEDDDLEGEGWRLVVWDTAVACLAISVKLHRDFLEPLCPVMSWEFEELAPHDILFEDLEARILLLCIYLLTVCQTAQRDILAGLQYRLGHSPQLLLDDLWLALPSLRELLHFQGGWNFVQKETWSRLYKAVLEPDVLKFSLSELTAAALIISLIYAVSVRIDFQQPLRGPMRGMRDQDKITTKAEREAAGVVQDIQALTGKFTRS